MVAPTSWMSASDRPACRIAASTAAESAGVHASDRSRTDPREHPRSEQALLPLAVQHRERRDVIGEIGRGEPFNRALAFLGPVTDRRRLRDELLELLRLGPGLILSGAFHDDALAAGRVGRVDARAVLELSGRLLPVAGHDGGPPFGTQRYHKVTCR